MNKHIYLSVLILLLLASPVSAGIDILDLGIGYDCIAHYGYVDYQPKTNSTGELFVFIDGKIVKTKVLDMKIRYLVGFKCNPIKTLEFELNETEGHHTILAVISSDNITSQRGYDYCAEDWWANEEEEEEIIQDWLSCWDGGLMK